MDNSFCPSVHEAGLSRSGHILLHHVDEGIGDTARHLIRGEAEGRLRVQDREHGEIAVEREFLLRLFPGDHGPAIHLGTRGGQGQYGTHGHGMIVIHLLYKFPRITVVLDAGGD